MRVGDRVQVKGIGGKVFRTGTITCHIEGHSEVTDARGRAIWHTDTMLVKDDDNTPTEVNGQYEFKLT